MCSHNVSLCAVPSAVLYEVVFVLRLSQQVSVVVSTLSAPVVDGCHTAPLFALSRTHAHTHTHTHRKPTRGIQYLVMSDILEDDPRCVAEFLMNQYGLSKQKIGEFLGEISSEFNMAVLECLVEHMEMGNKPIDEALRQFQQIFRMPVSLVCTLYSMFSHNSDLWKKRSFREILQCTF